MSSFIVNELVSILEYKVKGEKQLDRFEKKLDKSERSASKRSSTIARTGKTAAIASKRNEKQIGDSLKRTNQSYKTSTKEIGASALKLKGLLAGVGVAAGIGFGKSSLADFAAFERRMTRIGLTADATAKETSEASKKIQDFATKFALPVESAAQGLDTLTASGFTLEKSLAFLPSVLATAQATGSSVDDIANSAVKSSDAFNILAKDSQKAFDIMVAGGNVGQFELKDMAQFIPTLSNEFASLGNEGLPGLQKLVALMQVVRARTGDSGTASTQLSSLFSEIRSEATAAKFKKFGVDLPQAIKKAEDSGEDLLQTLVKITQEVQEEKGANLEQLFGRKEAIRAMRSLAGNTQEYHDILKKIGLDNSLGSTAKQLNRVLDDTQASIDRLSTNWDRFKTNFGAGLSDIVTPTLENINDGFDRERSLENLQEEQRILDKKNGVEQGAIGKFFGSEIGLDQRIGDRVLKTEGFDSF